MSGGATRLDWLDGMRAWAIGLVLLLTYFVASVTMRLIERPGIALGKALADRLTGQPESG